MSSSKRGEFVQKVSMDFEAQGPCPSIFDNLDTANTRLKKVDAVFKEGYVRSEDV